MNPHLSRYFVYYTSLAGHPFQIILGKGCNPSAKKILYLHKMNLQWIYWIFVIIVFLFP